MTLFAPATTAHRSLRDQITADHHHRLIAHLLTSAGWRVGMTNTDGVYVNGRQTDSGDCSGQRNVLMHPDVDAAVFEIARGGVLRRAWGLTAALWRWSRWRRHLLRLNYITTVRTWRCSNAIVVQNVATNWLRGAQCG
jgi:cyanophycin synthetase